MSTITSETRSAAPLPGGTSSVARIDSLPGAAACAISADRLEVRAGTFAFSASNIGFRSGVVTAIVGPNGSGKSTLLEALFGFRRAEVTNARILGAPAAQFMREPRQLRRLGAQLQRVEYTDSARVREILDVHRALYRRQDPIVEDALAIGELMEKPYRGLSKGQRQRLDLFVALAHRPELAVLDEPFTGLDRTVTRSVLDLLRGPLAGTTIVMICHAGEELEAVDDLLWVHGGGIRYRGLKAALKHELVGEFRAFIQLDSDEQVRGARSILSVDASVLHVTEPEPRRICAFGTAGLDRTLRTLMEEAGVSRFEFAPTDDGDLLRACTQGDLDA
ncbi:ABC-2 type transport system ATP-binding protein [Trinickia symbiotica]|uniref:Phosphonate ABC transporter ATP-binding protein n=1 Tax=Trinickia symbiotica TaxID=863227 RepID=A0A2N7X9I0_9BURK|nr:ATP-binding cassette domain-containing protein [Trinickia symbiotica]PMS38416.1 phosphonate ABC transporter ATP-binding protein [Trinickia symbiotica]PPK46425.1 ABC-2 type transport system ATP-binding protein [Trinickia symbiotica]